jgi:probable F420-dependent oxidoreductase
MLQLARERASGTHTYNVTPAHTAWTRDQVGPHALVLPEQRAVLTSDPHAARAIGREYLSRYLAMPNYVNAWRRLGFGDGDLASGGSNRLVDSVVAWGDEEAIVRRVQEHAQAGADHVAVQVIGHERSLSRATWRALAPGLAGG